MSEPSPTNASPIATPSPDAAPQPEAARAPSDADTPIAASDAAPEAGVGPKDGDKLTKRFAALSKREKDLRARAKAVEEREQRLAAYDEAERLAKEDPLAFIERFNLDYSGLTERVLSKHAERDPVGELKSEVERLKSEREAERLAAESAQRDAALDGFKREARAFVDSDPAAHELIISEGAHDEVYELIAGDVLRQLDEGVPAAEVVELPFAKAARLVEAELERAEAERIGRLLKSKKLAKYFQPSTEGIKDIADHQRGAAPAAPPHAAGGDVAAADERGRQPVTLTNGHVSRANPHPGSGPTRSLEESKAKAAALLRFTR